MISLLYAAIGLIFGVTRPFLGLGFLLMFVVVTPSLPWQLGWPNIAAPHLYTGGLLCGWLLTGFPHLRPGESDASMPTEAIVPIPREIRSPLALATIGIAVATILNLARLFPLAAEPLASSLHDILARIVEFNPAGVAGTIQAGLVPLAGLALIWMATAFVGKRGNGQYLVHAFLAGAFIASTTPLLLWLILDPTVRPDKRIVEGEGIVGLFQDPHSFASYLVLALGVALGKAASTSHARVFRRAIPWVLLAMAAFGALLFTNSRTGLLAAVGVCALFGSLAWTTSRESTPARERSSPFRAVVALTAAILVVVVIAVAVAPPARHVAYEALSAIGNERMWEPLRPGGPERPLHARRILLWKKGIALTATSPLWGEGPRGFERAGPLVDRQALDRFAATYGAPELELARRELAEENAHAYFLQLAAEYGVPALLSYLALVGGCLVVIIGGIRSSDEPSRRFVLVGALCGQLGFLATCLVAHPLLLMELQAAFWLLTVGAVGVAVHTPNEGLQPR